MFKTTTINGIVKHADVLPGYVQSEPCDYCIYYEFCETNDTLLDCPEEHSFVETKSTREDKIKAKPVKAKPKHKISVIDDQVYFSGRDTWSVSRLIALSQELKPFKISMKHLNYSECVPKATTTTECVEHVRAINNADLSYPIILDSEGSIMDGRHRIIKALVTNEKSILAVRFDITPEPDYRGEDTK